MNTKDDTTLDISEVISLLRFPLAVLVVFIHVEGYYFHFEDMSACTYHITHFISNIICKVAVPTFYFISGYLFFYNVNKFTLTEYKSKLSSRAKNIIVPYLVWNTIAFLIFIIAKFLGIGCYVTNFTVTDNIVKNLIQIYGYTFDWGWTNSLFQITVNQYTPLDVPLWFLRDLIIIAVLTPIIFLLVRKLGRLLVFIFFALLLLFQYPTLSAFFYFTLGSYFSINKRDPLCFYEKYKKLLWISIMVLLAPSYFYGFYFKQILLVPFLFVLMGGGKYVSRNFASKLMNLSKYSFCLYCTHMIITLPIAAIIFSIIDIVPIVYYFACGIGSIITSMILYHVLKPVNKYLKIV